MDLTDLFTCPGCFQIRPHCDCEVHRWTGLAKDGSRPPRTPRKTKPPTVPSTFRVAVHAMKESHRTTYHVCLDRGDRPLDAKPWDKGRICPYMSEHRDRADFTAAEWAAFLGVEVTPTPTPDWLKEEENVAKR